MKNPGLNLVTVPGGLPTGIVGNATTDFAITPCAVASCPAAFIWASITGKHHRLEPERGSKLNHRRDRSQPRGSCLYGPCQWQQLGRQPPLRRRLQQWQHRRLRRHLRADHYYRQLSQIQPSPQRPGTLFILTTSRTLVARYMLCMPKSAPMVNPRMVSATVSFAASILTACAT